jgi:peptidoglycan/LPS O-acetylase OafA/YrhL
MHTEHLQNVRWSWVFFGWFVSVAVVSLIVLALIALRLLTPDATGGDLAWGVAAITAGFLAGGWLTGARVRMAPILHGIGIGLVSLLLWFVANLIPGEALGATTWDGPPAFYAGMLILQMLAAAAGAHVGTRGPRMASA